MLTCTSLLMFSALIATFGDVNAAIDRLLQQRQRWIVNS